MDVVDGHHIVVVNCGDQPFPLSSDKLERIEAARGVSSFGRAGRCLASLTATIWEVTVVDRAEGDECLILSSNGLWDVVSNETTREVALVYL
jgi:protein phosphatase 2C